MQKSVGVGSKLDKVIIIYSTQNLRVGVTVQDSCLKVAYIIHLFKAATSLPRIFGLCDY